MLGQLATVLTDSCPNDSIFYKVPLGQSNWNEPWFEPGKSGVSFVVAQTCYKPIILPRLNLVNRSFKPVTSVRVFPEIKIKREGMLRIDMTRKTIAMNLRN